MGGKKKLMRLLTGGEKREASRGSGFAHNLSGHGTLSLERQAGTLLKMMAPTECSNPISAYAHVHVREHSSEDNSSSDDGFHTDAHHDTDSDPGRDSLHSADDDNIYENAYCSPVGGGLTTNFIGSEDFGTTVPALSSTMTAGPPDDENCIMGNHISSNMMTESEYATLPAITLRAAANRFKAFSENGADNTLQKKKKSQLNVMRLKKPCGNRWSTRISTDFFNRNSKNRGSSGRRKGKNAVKKIVVLNDFSPSSSTTDPHSPICSDSDSLDSGRCGDSTSLHSTGSSSHATSTDEVEPALAQTTSSIKSHRRCPSISNISFSTINCHSPCGKSVPVIKVTPQKMLPSVDETPESQLVNAPKDTEDGVTNFGRADNGKDNKVTAKEDQEDITNNNNVPDVNKETQKANVDISKLPDFMQTRAPIYSVLHYVDHLKKQLSNNTIARAAAINKTPQIKDGISPLSYLLRKLKLDLKMSYDSFVQEFVEPPQDGIGLLVSLLRDIQQYQQSGTTTRRSKLDQYKKSLTDEHDCLLCIKFSLRVEGGIDKLLDIRYGLETVTACLLSSFSKARVTALEILTVSLTVPDGYSRVLDSMTYIRLKFGESVRFKLLVSMLNSQGSVYVLFQLVCMRFLNTLMTCTSGQNARVFLQYELEMAGLDMSQLEKNAQGDGLEYDDLRREIEIWKKRFVDVQGLQDELMALQNRCSLLRHEVDSKEDKIKALEDTQADLETEVGQLRESCNSYVVQNATLQESVEKMKLLCKKKGGKEAKAQDDIPVSTDTQSTQKEKTDMSETTQPSIASSDADSYETFIIPAIPPPPPPPPAPEMFKLPKRNLSVQPKVRLPLLNWQPLSNAENTVFQAMDEDQLYKELNLEEFESRFKLKTTESPQSSPSRSEKLQKKSSNTIQLLGSDRMRNIVIAKRKIGLTGTEVREYVDQFDVTRVSGDYAELLLRFLPSKDEKKLLSGHSGEFSKLGEAEQFLYHLGHINDCKTKLTVMAFMGAFDDVTKLLNTQIEVIQKASVSLLSSWKLRKLFQLILALGNYMNCKRRGVAVGFRLESLSKLGDVKTTDRQHTFQHYLVELLETQFPTLVDWQDDLEIAVPRSSSYQSVVTDVKNLKRGLAQIQVEFEKHPDVKQLQVFHERASRDMDKITEMYSQMEEFYEKACSTYGESHTQIEPGEFFGYFLKFIKSYKKAAVDNHKSSVNSSGASSPIHPPSSTVGTPPKHDFLTEAKRLMSQNSHRLATSRALENGFTEIAKRQKTGASALPSPIPTVTNGIQARIQNLSSEPYGLDLQATGSSNNASSKEIVNNWILQNTESEDFKNSDGEQKFRTSTLKSICSPERLPLPSAKRRHDSDDASILSQSDDVGHVAGSTLKTSGPIRGDPSPDYTNPSSPANTISNASEISRVLREFEGNIHTYLNENLQGAKEPVPARPVDFYRPVTYL